MNKEVVYATLVNIFGGCIYGFNTGIVSGLTYPLLKCTLAHDEWSAETLSFYQGLFNALLLVFAIPSSPISVWIAKKWGLKWSLIVTGIIALICPLAMIAYSNYWYMTIIRGFLGLAIGFTSAICPMYSATIVEEKYKGKVTTIFQLSICVSICLAQVFNFCFTPAFDDHTCTPLSFFQYAIQLGFGAVFAILLLITMIFAPNAFPSKGKVASSLSLLKSVDGNKSSNLFAKRNFKWLCFSFMLAVMNQLTGINGVIFYAPQILQNAGVDNALLIQILIVGVWNAVTVVVFMFFVDKLSRQLILNISIGIMVIGCISLIVAFNVSGSVVFAFIGMLCFIFGFETGPGPLFFVMASHDFPSALFDIYIYYYIYYIFLSQNLPSNNIYIYIYIDQGLSVANIFVWILNTALSFSFPIITAALGSTWTFAILGALQLLCILYFDLSMKNGHMTTGESNLNLLTIEQQ
ncbi:hypothetical protein WA158_005527 [Blastocystis sp. Blastoise]